MSWEKKQDSCQNPISLNINNLGKGPSRQLRESVIIPDTIFSAGFGKVPKNQCIDGYDGFRPKMRPENSVNNPDSAVGATPQKLHNLNGLRTGAGGFSP